MRWMILAWSCGFVAMMAPGCVLLSPGADGESCVESRDCDSNNCNQGYCRGSDCSDDESVCRTGWKCSHFSADPITGFFGNDGSDVCVATCGYCPGNSHCAEGGIEGETTCTFGKAPLVLQLADSSAVVGQKVTLSVAAKDGASLRECTWNLGESSGVLGRGGSIEHTFRYGQAIRIGVSCTDDDDRNGQADALVDVSCQALGSACDPALCCAGNTRESCLSGDAPGTFVCRAPRPPTVTVSGPTEVAVNVSVQFSASVQGDGEVSKVEWTFSDSSFGERGPIVEHSFARAGSYSVRATVTDSNGNEGWGGLNVTAR